MPGSSSRSANRSDARRRRLAVRRSSARSRASSSSSANGFDEVVVGARVEAGDPVVDLVARGQHQHRRAVAARAQPPADLEAVELPGISTSRITASGALAVEPDERLVAVGGELDLVPLELEGAPQRFADRAFVVDDQDLHVPILAPPV